MCAKNVPFTLLLPRVIAKKAIIAFAKNCREGASILGVEEDGIRERAALLPVLCGGARYFYSVYVRSAISPQHSNNRLLMRIKQVQLACRLVRNMEVDQGIPYNRLGTAEAVPKKAGIRMESSSPDIAYASMIWAKPEGHWLRKGGVRTGSVSQDLPIAARSLWMAVGA